MESQKTLFFGFRISMSNAGARITEELNKGHGLSIVELVDAIVAHAYELQASDIHVDPQQEDIKLRIRIDGVLQTTHTLPRGIYDEIVSRVKVLSNLRTDEHQAAQDGRFRTVLDNGQHIDVRVSIVPTYYGENIVMRLLTDNQDQFTLEALGYRPEEYAKISKALKRPYGMILVTGPTGSGKTTTLYTFLKMLNKDDVSFITIEDPIEYSVQGVTQIQTNPKHGLTFANGLRSILRQDPDLIMVGEIRDSETAGIAVNTALTGHLLFSTLHTSDAVTSLPRLRDMGIEPYLIAATVNLLIAQRLLRKTCKKCAKKQPVTDAEKESLKGIIPDQMLTKLDTQMVGQGCSACNDTGFKGRLCINEVIEINEPIREAILTKASSAALKSLAVQGGMTPMLEDGCLKVMSGDTTIEEVLRVINE